MVNNFWSIKSDNYAAQIVIKFLSNYVVVPGQPLYLVARTLYGLANQIIRFTVTTRNVCDPSVRLLQQWINILPCGEFHKIIVHGFNWTDATYRSVHCLCDSWCTIQKFLHQFCINFLYRGAQWTSHWPVRVLFVYLSLYVAHRPCDILINHCPRKLSFSSTKQWPTDNDPRLRNSSPLIRAISLDQSSSLWILDSDPRVQCIIERCYLLRVKERKKERWELAPGDRWISDYRIDPSCFAGDSRKEAHTSISPLVRRNSTAIETTQNNARSASKLYEEIVLDLGKKATWAEDEIEA